MKLRVVCDRPSRSLPGVPMASQSKRVFPLALLGLTLLTLLGLSLIYWLSPEWLAM
jgi:hypothetical protein